MKKMLFLGAYGFGNLGDELCLVESMSRFDGDEKWVRSVDPSWTRRTTGADLFHPWPPSRQPPGAAVEIDAMVVGGGGIMYGESALDFLSWVGAAQRGGAETHIHNVAVSHFPDVEWLTPEVVGALQALSSFSVRDEASAEIVRGWGIGLEPALVRFPEKDVAPDDSLVHLLPERPLVGISITSHLQMTNALERSAERVKTALKEFSGMAVVPIVSVLHRDAAEDDAVGFKRFAETFLSEFDIVLPEMLDPEWWWSSLTPRNLKAIIGRCSVLISQRKHNCVHGIGSGVRVIGMNPAEDDSLRRVFSSLAEFLHPDSELLPL